MWILTYCIEDMNIRCALRIRFVCPTLWYVYWDSLDVLQVLFLRTTFPRHHCDCQRDRRQYSRLFSPSKYWQTVATKVRRSLHLVQIVKVKHSHYRPGQDQRVPGGSGSWISRHLVHESGKVISPTHRPLLPPRKYSWYSFLLDAVSTPSP